MSAINILVIGSGGREHALCHRLKQSPSCARLFCAPGNGGIAQDAECVSISSHQEIIDFCKKETIGLVVIGPEAPLVAGLADDLDKAGIPVFGPSAKAAQLEGSKGYTKDLCAEYDIPTAAYGRFDDAKSARAYVEAQGAPIVVKADGLAAGKGVIVAMTKDEALDAVDEIFSGKFGSAGTAVVIEEYLEGEEVSFFALADGNTASFFGAAQDHKRVGDGDTGPNTGGMGTYSPAPILTDALTKQVMEQIILPTVKGMKQRSIPYKGVFFAGLMMTKSGPKLIEYNARFGDPETQVLMMRLTSDLVPLLLACANGKLSNAPVAFDPRAAVCVVMAANGYPGDYVKGTEIKGLEKAASLPDVKVFHAGTAVKEGKVIATGGRVLGVTALGATIADTQAQAYKAVDSIDWKDGFCRRDIAAKAIKKNVA